MNHDTNGVFFQGIVVKLNSDLSVAWSQDYGLNSGADQIFDLVVDRLFRWIFALNLICCCILFYSATGTTYLEVTQLPVSQTGTIWPSRSAIP